MIEQSIEELIDSLNDAVDDIRKHPTKIDRVPSNLEIMLSGVRSEKGAGFLFSDSVDKLASNLLDKAASGNLNLNIDEKTITKIFDKFGIGEGSFEGPVSQALVDTIDRSISSPKFLNTKSKLQKVRVVYSNLKKKRKEFADNLELRKKYDDAVYALKKILIIVNKIMKNKRLITKRVSAGIHNLINEDLDSNERIERIEF